MQYHVIDLANIDVADLDLVNRTFSLWQNVYSQELQSRGLELHPEEFWNARLLAVITNKTDVIGAHLYNVFDLRSLATTHKYFSDITPERVQSLLQQKAYKLMSMEYLLVNPAYRGKQADVRWGEVVIGLGFQVLQHSPWDGAIGVARMDKNVHSMSKKMGGNETEQLTKNQTPCAVMTMTKAQMKPHDDLKVQNMITSLWNNKHMTSPWNIEIPARLKVA